MVLYFLEDNILIFIAERMSYLTSEVVFMSACFSLSVYILILFCWINIYAVTCLLVVPLSVN